MTTWDWLFKACRWSRWCFVSFLPRLVFFVVRPTLYKAANPQMERTKPCNVVLTPCVSVFTFCFPSTSHSPSHLFDYKPSVQNSYRWHQFLVRFYDIETKSQDKIVETVVFDCSRCYRQLMYCFLFSFCAFSLKGELFPSIFILFL